jgi:hypothetical protein
LAVTLVHEALGGKSISILHRLLLGVVDSHIVIVVELLVRLVVAVKTS